MKCFLGVFGVCVLSCAAMCQAVRPIRLAERVLVVYNADETASKNVAKYYMNRRVIPPTNICAIHESAAQGELASSFVEASNFVKLVKHPIEKCLQAVGPENILYIVFSYETPYRILNLPESFGVAIDSYIADIWNAAFQPHSDNPYYAAIGSKRAIYPHFISLADYRNSPHVRPIYSVWRLDAPTELLARGLVDKAIAAEGQILHGQACIDRRYGDEVKTAADDGLMAGDWDLFRAAQFLREAGIEVVEDSHLEEFGTPPAPLRCDDAIFYAGWYSLSHYNDAFTWKTGAIGLHLDSLSAANPRGGGSWAPSAVARGITVTSGAVGEPFLEGLPHPDGVVHDLLAGAAVGDALLRNTHWLKWMIINIGDPLYAPRFK